MTGRPVKLVLTRAQMFGPVGHRGQTRQRLRLGMERDGRLTAVSHHAIAATSSFDDFIEPSAGVSRMLYASPAIATTHEAVRNDIGTPRPSARAGRRLRIGGARGGNRRSGGGLRHGPARLPARELCGGRTDNRQALFVEGAARMLRPGRDGVRLVGPAAWPAADARRGRLPRRLGHGNRRVPLPDVRGRGAGGAARRRHRRHRDERNRHGAGRLDRARADRGRQPRARHRPGHVALRQLRPARRRRRRRLRPYGDRRLGHRRGRQERRRAARRARHG